MNYKEAVTKAIRKINPPKGQLWVTLEQLIKAAEKLDDDKKRSSRKH